MNTPVVVPPRRNRQFKTEFKTPKHIRDLRRARYWENPEKVRAQNRSWRAKNLKRAREIRRKWQRSHPEEAYAYVREWKLKHPEKHRNQTRLYRAKKIKKGEAPGALVRCSCGHIRVRSVKLAWCVSDWKKAFTNCRCLKCRSLGPKKPHSRTGDRKVDP